MILGVTFHTKHSKSIFRCILHHQDLNPGLLNPKRTVPLSICPFLTTVLVWRSRAHCSTWPEFEPMIILFQNIIFCSNLFSSWKQRIGGGGFVYSVVFLILKYVQAYYPYITLTTSSKTNFSQQNVGIIFKV